MICDTLAHVVMARMAHVDAEHIRAGAKQIGDDGALGRAGPSVATILLRRSRRIDELPFLNFRASLSGDTGIYIRNMVAN